MTENNYNKFLKLKTVEIHGKGKKPCLRLKKDQFLDVELFLIETGARDMYMLEIMKRMHEFISQESGYVYIRILDTELKTRKLLVRCKDVPTANTLQFEAKNIYVILPDVDTRSKHQKESQSKKNTKTWVQEAKNNRRKHARPHRDVDAPQKLPNVKKQEPKLKRKSESGWNYPTNKRNRNGRTLKWSKTISNTSMKTGVKPPD